MSEKIHLEQVAQGPCAQLHRNSPIQQFLHLLLCSDVECYIFTSSSLNSQPAVTSCPKTWKEFCLGWKGLHKMIVKWNTEKLFLPKFCCHHKKGSAIHKQQGSPMLLHATLSPHWRVAIDPSTFQYRNIQHTALGISHKLLQDAGRDAGCSVCSLVCPQPLFSEPQFICTPEERAGEGVCSCITKERLIGFDQEIAETYTGWEYHLCVYSNEKHRFHFSTNFSY